MNVCFLQSNLILTNTEGSSRPGLNLGIPTRLGRMEDGGRQCSGKVGVTGQAAAKLG